MMKGVISMDGREKYLYKDTTKFTEREEYCDHHKTEDTRRTDGEEIRKIMTRT
jgi:hypothetical protein